MKKAIFVITLTLVALVIAGSAIGCTKKTTTAVSTTTLPSLTGTWKINSGGSFDAGSSGNGTFGRDFIITVKQENTSLQGTGKDVSGGRPADLAGKEVILSGEVKDGSKVTFTIHEDFPAMGNADLVHEFTGTVSGGKITGTFQGGFDFPIKYRIKGQFVVSVGSAGSTTTSTITTTSTPTVTPSPVDVSGTWSGTYSEKSGGWYVYYDMTINFDPPYQHLDADIVQGWMALNVVKSEGGTGYMSGGQHIGVPSRVLGNTITLSFPLAYGIEEITCQVSGNSMTGSGTYTDKQRSTTYWSLNLTRVR